MSDDERFCRRCLLLESGKDDIILDIRQRIQKLSKSEKAEDDIYQSRLDVCRVCDFLLDGTCLKCGCYPEFKAAFKRQRCPQNKWKN